MASMKPGGGEGDGSAGTRIVALAATQAAARQLAASGIVALLRPSSRNEAVRFDGRRVYWAEPGDALDERLPEVAVASGADALVVDTGETRLLDRFGFAALSAMADACRARRIGIGFAGGLEAPDVPRLMPLRPVLLGFEGAAAIDVDGVRKDAAPFEASAMLAAPPDLVFIRDFVQEMEIGAYASESGRRQRVRFSIEAELGPCAQRRSIGDIYSYDRMMDAVRALAARAPRAFVETLAEELSHEILSDERVRAVTVRVEKLDLGPAAAGVEIRRQRG